MILNFTTLNRNGQRRAFSWWFTSIEFSLDALSAASLKGSQIIKAELVDEQGSIQLPVAAFDGHVLSTALRGLEMQWSEVLNTSLRRESSKSKPSQLWETSVEQGRDN